MTKEKNKVKISTIAYAIIIVFIFYIIVVGLVFYISGPSNPIISGTAKIIPFPVAIVDSTSFINYGEMAQKMNFAKTYYESEDFSQTGERVDFTTPEGKKRLKVKEKQLLSKMTEDKIIELLANESGIKIIPEMVRQEVERKIDQYGDAKKVQEKLNKYGWTMKDFENNIVMPAMYREKLLINFIQTDETRLEALEKISNAKKDLDNKIDFAETVKKYSEGESAENGGYVGWFNKDQMLPEVALLAFSMKKGEMSDIFQSTLGFHIIKIENRRTMNGEDQLEIRQIFVRTKSLTEWLLEKEKNMKIFIPFKGIYWDKEIGEVLFSDEDLIKLEESILQEDYGDASF